jgi:hypothetical protein
MGAFDGGVLHSLGGADFRRPCAFFAPGEDQNPNPDYRAKNRAAARALERAKPEAHEGDRALLHTALPQVNEETA